MLIKIKYPNRVTGLPSFKLAECLIEFEKSAMDVIKVLFVNWNQNVFVEIVSFLNSSTCPFSPFKRYAKGKRG